MSEDRQVRAEVEVTVDAGTAFRAFTEEMNLWWVRGPVNFFDAARATAMTCEPGVGGRLLEVYDLAAGDVLELGRITVWQPGEQLSWRSSVDGVRVDVRFAATATGTMVRVTATIPAGTTDQGGTAWVRVVPPWFGAYCERRTRARLFPERLFPERMLPEQPTRAASRSRSTTPSRSPPPTGWPAYSACGPRASCPPKRAAGTGSSSWPATAR